MSNEKNEYQKPVKRDDEKVITMAVCGIFSGVLLAVLFSAGNIFHMGLLLTVLAVIAIAGCAYAWYKIFKHFDDPNKNYWRLLCILFAIAAIITIMGHRAGWLEKKQVKADSATEAARP